MTTENKDVQEVKVNPIATGEITNSKLTAEEVTAVLGEVPAGYSRQETHVNFKKRSLQDSEGNAIPNSEFKPDRVKVFFNVPTLEKLFEIATTDSKVGEMILALVGDKIAAPLRSQIEELYEDGTPALLENLDFSNVTVEQAALDFAATGRESLTDEQVDAALRDFAAWNIEQGREQKKVEATVNVIKGKFAKIRTNKPMLERVGTVLVDWAKSAEGVQETHSMFLTRTGALLEKLLKAEEKDLSADIL